MAENLIPTPVSPVLNPLPAASQSADAAEQERKDKQQREDALRAAEAAAQRRAALQERVAPRQDRLMDGRLEKAALSEDAHPTTSAQGAAQAENAAAARLATMQPREGAGELSAVDRQRQALRDAVDFALAQAPKADGVERRPNLVEYVQALVEGHSLGKGNVFDSTSTARLSADEKAQLGLGVETALGQLREMAQGQGRHAVVAHGASAEEVHGLINHLAQQLSLRLKGAPLQATLPAGSAPPQGLTQTATVSAGELEASGRQMPLQTLLSGGAKQALTHLLLQMPLPESVQSLLLGKDRQVRMQLWSAFLQMSAEVKTPEHVAFKDLQRQFIRTVTAKLAPLLSYQPVPPVMVNGQFSDTDHFVPPQAAVEDSLVRMTHAMQYARISGQFSMAAMIGLDHLSQRAFTKLQDLAASSSRTTGNEPRVALGFHTPPALISLLVD